MPNRILKESICTSDNINELSPYEEIFFYRLIVNCDDYGIMDARTSILRAKCFPLKIDLIKESDIEDWLINLIDAELIFLYEIEGRRYLKMTSWEKHQQIRAHRSKFPMPDSGGYHLKSDDIKSPRNPIQSNPIQSESESESNPRELVSDDAPDGAHSRSEKVPFTAIIQTYNSTCRSLPKAQTATEGRKRAMRVLWKRAPDLDQITDLFKRAEASDFLTGRDGKWTGCGFDWLIKPANMTKLQEGNYDNKEPPKPKSDFFSGINEWVEREGLQ